MLELHSKALSGESTHQYWVVRLLWQPEPTALWTRISPSVRSSLAVLIDLKSLCDPGSLAELGNNLSTFTKSTETWQFVILAVNAGSFSFTSLVGYIVSECCRVKLAFKHLLLWVIYWMAGTGHFIFFYFYTKKAWLTGIYIHQLQHKNKWLIYFNVVTDHTTKSSCG